LIDCKFLNIFVTIFALIGWRLQGEIKKKLFTAVLHLHNTQPLLSKDRRSICSIREFSPASTFADFSVGGVGGSVGNVGRHKADRREEVITFPCPQKNPGNFKPGRTL